jgi:hypothetical protein
MSLTPAAVVFPNLLLHPVYFERLSFWCFAWLYDFRCFTFLRVSVLLYPAKQCRMYNIKSVSALTNFGGAQDA